MCGLGIVHLPLIVVRPDIDEGRLVNLLPNWAPKPRLVHAAFPSRRGLLPSVRALIDFLGEEFSRSNNQRALDCQEHEVPCEVMRTDMLCSL